MQLEVLTSTSHHQSFMEKHVLVGAEKLIFVFFPSISKPPKKFGHIDHGEKVLYKCWILSEKGKKNLHMAIDHTKRLAKVLSKKTFYFVQNLCFSEMC